MLAAAAVEGRWALACLPQAQTPSVNRAKEISGAPRLMSLT